MVLMNDVYLEHGPCLENDLDMGACRQLARLEVKFHKAA